MSRGSSSTDSIQEILTTSEATACESSHRPRGKFRRFLGEVKDGVNKLKISRSKDSRSHSQAVLPNVYHKHTSSTSVQAAPSGVEVEADTQSILRDAQEAVKCMHPLLGPAITVVSVGQDAQVDLDAADNFQDTYLEPLRIFDDVIGKIADVWTLLLIGTVLI
ncbi:hypothetical protein DFJ58DRAFT_323125 [Suillus subalutaceus]|uniref:uncharacterized protein n=1 Tax=Suillus subalutaceus TaxID=48586 RepID=UPI001B872700|nr:uncharacterized protein DFJ58DRAFT_323125 [Suillus subalutaceus]KAG1874759.1 hypothetical protein DFJ58DRAFT_323125 [Suillus subalutaceus]